MERRRGETNRTIWAKVSLKIAEIEQLYQVKRMIGHVVLDLFSNFRNQSQMKFEEQFTELKECLVDGGTWIETA